MKAFGPNLRLSATDLSNFLGCRQRTALEMAEAHGKHKRPHFDDPLLELLFKRGTEHEKKYVASLEDDGRQIVDLEEERDPDRAVDQTLAAMRGGVDVIVQGALKDGWWFGRPDVMQRVEKPSLLGAWSYEISDTKLARETRGGTILQLGLYSEMLASTQGARPEHFYVVTPDPDTPVHKYRVDDYAAYVRLIRAQMLEMIALDDDAVAAANYPEPVDHCEICPWRSECVKRWRLDDHLSLVAGISRIQRHELESRHVKTLAELAQLPMPLPFKPERGGRESYERMREQARLQFESRGRIPPLHELRLPFEEGAGLCRLPEPSPADIFLDLEGDLFAAEGGREYLFGVVTVDASGVPSYRSFWAFTDAEERAAFESVMDLIIQAWKADENMHVYHYASYEPTAFKRLMGRYASREQELDKMLRGGRFVDLYAVVRQGLRAGIESYSIKSLEALYAFERAVPLVDAGRSRARMEYALQLNCLELVPSECRDAVEGYNKDDCISTLRLREWLERLRSEVVAEGTSLPRPIPKEGDPSEELDERAKRVDALRARLLTDVPDVPSDQTAEQHARWLLAYMLDWHRREDKAAWWEYYRLRELPEEDLFDEPEAIAGLEHVERLGFALSKKGKPTKSVIDRYAHPVQEMEIGRGAKLKLQDGTGFGEVVEVDRAARTIDIRKGPSQANNHPTAIFAHNHVNTGVLEEALYQLGERVAADKTIGDGKARTDAAARDLLMSRPPRLRSGDLTSQKAVSVVELAVRLASDLDDTVLAIQGPPGSGKTYTGAQMILALVKQGNKVGITATSHKVIRNLLDAVAKAAKEASVMVKLAHKTGDDENPRGSSPVKELESNEDALEALASGDAQVLGGTAWLWARPELAHAVDVLFVDEAGQMSLANVLAVSHCAASIVLLGDPQQLDQPQKGSHPEGVDASALQHILGANQTISPDRGIFLPVTWRLCPNICSFTSEMFYENRLKSKTGLERQTLNGIPELHGSGLWMAEVEHNGNRNASLEEVDVVAELVARLTAAGSQWIDEHGNARQMTANDILIVAPYNAHVTRLTERLGTTGVRVGTVDKFQGQEAPVVIYSTATSRPEDAPRGMNFLYNLNRLNVATSRARCAVILVTNPRLFEPDCRTPIQMKLANALCRFRELAKPVK